MFTYQSGDATYRITTNDTYGYRIELDIFNNSLDYMNIKKNSIRSSLAVTIGFNLI